MRILSPITLASCFVALLASCGNSYRRDDKVFERDSGRFVGTILEVGTNHTYENGMSGRSIRFRHEGGRDIWAREDAFFQSYEVRQ